jgi:hypothetical protein
MAIKSKAQLSVDIAASTFSAPQQVILDDIVDSYEDIFSQLTTAQRDALSPAPSAGQVIYNTDNDRYEYYNGTGWLGMGQNVSTPITVKVDLTSAELKALDTVPKVLVSAYAADYAIIPISLSTRYTYGTAAYAGTFTSLAVKCSSKTNTDYFFLINKSGVLNQTTNKSGFNSQFGSDTLDSIVVNDDVELKANGTVTTGDGTLTVWFTYSIVQY